LRRETLPNKNSISVEQRSLAVKTPYFDLRKMFASFKLTYQITRENIMTYQRISATNLLRSTFDVVGSLYLPLLIINSPDLIGNSLTVFFFNNQDLASAINGWKISGVVTWNNIIYYLNLIYSLCAVPLLWGATIFYTYQSLTGNQVTVGEAFQHAYRRLPQLIWAWIPIALMLYIFFSSLEFLQPLMVAAISKNLFPLVSAGLIALMISWSYLLTRLQFSLFATAIDNAAAQDSISSSWKLTKGRWWLLCRANFLIFIVTGVPLQLIPLLTSNLMYYLPFSSVFLVIYHLVVIVLQISMGVLTSVYLVLLYRRLRDSAATIQ
jgi:hypothetical protein